MIKELPDGTKTKAPRGSHGRSANELIIEAEHIFSKSREQMMAEGEIKRCHGCGREAHISQLDESDHCLTCR
ncbi:MAG: hypothetical protein WC915_04120 [archaeon]